jgi:hypothetical protein
VASATPALLPRPVRHMNRVCSHSSFQSEAIHPSAPWYCACLTWSVVLLQVEAGSYDNIALSLGTDAPADILFATDNVHEAEAAVAAGWQVLVVPRLKAQQSLLPALLPADRPALRPPL